MPARRKPLRPKLPARNDSKEVVEAILGAARSLLEEGGLESFTTNHIAARAGVGVASVYRYFADKEAIIAEMDLRNRRDNAERLHAALAEIERDFQGAIRELLRHFLDTSGPRGRLRRTVVSEVPLSWIASNASSTLESLIESCTGALTKLRPELPVPEIRRRIHVAFHAVQGVAIGQLVFPIDELDLEGAVALMERMVMAVLLAPAPAS
ncbi:MAG: TetR/AcrR family transcriptional regulator [Deltaproteobacteria bacterium]|nr:TetR/AcrR family transcriptional regulator [Deltaproteobacteria bacterium]